VPGPDKPALDDDEEAFHWAGDEVGGREGPRLPKPGAADAVVGVDPDLAPASTSPRRGSAALTGLFGVLFLTITVGWILATGYTSAGVTELLPQVLWQFGEFTAIIAGPMWFGTTLLLTRGRLGVRVAFLMLGLGVLLPWPLFPLLVVGA
jgi:hypothetical protein